MARKATAVITTRIQRPGTGCNDCYWRRGQFLGNLCRMRIHKFLCIFCLSVSAWAQHLVKQDIFNAIAAEYSGEGALENVRNIVQYHRIQASPMMESVAKDFVLPRLKAAGLDAGIEQFNSDGKTKYGTYTSPMGWDIRSGELWVESAGGTRNFTPIRLCRYG